MANATKAKHAGSHRALTVRRHLGWEEGALSGPEAPPLGACALSSPSLLALRPARSLSQATRTQDATAIQSRSFSEVMALLKSRQPAQLDLPIHGLLLTLTGKFC